MKFTRGKLIISKLIAVLSLSFFTFTQANADTVALIGTGNVSGTLGVRFAEMGHDVVYGHRDPQRADNQELARRTGPDTRVVLPAESVVGADIVVLGVPGTVVVEVAASLGDLNGKIVIDPTNPLYPDPDDGLARYLYPLSTAELIQNMYPEASVIKAFNVLTMDSMNNAADIGGPIGIPYAGGTAEAKALVAEVIESFGIQAIDFGPIRYAKLLEEMRAVASNFNRRGDTFDYYFQFH